MNIQILGLVGRKGAGKSHIAGIIEDLEKIKVKENRITLWGVVRSFATPFKEMLEQLPIEDMNARLYGDKKNDPEHTILGGKTMRDAMNTLGTEWGRDLIHPDIWVNCMKVSLAKEYIQNTTMERLYVIDDVRVENEVDYIRSLGGTILSVVSVFQEAQGDHSTEALDVSRFPVVVNDNASNESLLDQLTKLTPWNFRC